MPYQATARLGRRKLIPNRWIDADKLFAWCGVAQTANVSVISERFELQSSLRDCYLNNIPATRVDESVQLVDAMCHPWMDRIQKLFNFLTDRPQVATKGGPTKQNGDGEAIRSGDALSRAFSTAIAAIVTQLLSEKDVLTRELFEVGLTWQDAATQNPAGRG
jgi:hypothetical protein